MNQLKDNTKEWTEKISKIMSEREQFRVALKFIAEFGGTVHETELGDINCDGKWAANQAMAALPHEDWIELSKQ